MRLLSRAAAPLALLAGFLAGPSVAFAHSERGAGSAWRAPTYVYLDNNTAGTNTISGFSRSADGALTALPGSPFPAGGAGLGAGLASQGASRRPRTAGISWRLMRAAIRSRCCASAGMGR
jgi:hypothetical protein